MISQFTQPTNHESSYLAKDTTKNATTKAFKNEASQNESQKQNMY